MNVTVDSWRIKGQLGQGRCSLCGPGVTLPCVRVSVRVSVCRSQAVEFSLDSGPELQRAGFSLDGPSGALERGQRQRIGVSWVPPADLQVRHGPARPGEGHTGVLEGVT